MRLTEDSQADIRGLAPRDRDRVHERLKLLRMEPRRAPGVTNLVRLEGYRMKVGRYRALFIVRDEDHSVLVTRVLLRNEGTYK